MIQPRYLIGFTGHRSGYDEAVVGPVLRRVLGDLLDCAKAVGGRADLYASVAEGADTLCVKTARELRMAVHLLLPLEEQDFAADFSSADAWALSKAEIDAARSRPGRDSVRLVVGEGGRPECYFNQGMHMLAAVDVLVTLWDGEPARGVGGTEQVVLQAKAISVPVIRIDSKTGQVEPPLESMKEPFVRDAVMRELVKSAERTGTDCAVTVGSAKDLQDCLDEVANREASRSRSSLMAIVLLHAVAALLATIVTFKVVPENATHWWNQSKWVLTAAEMVLVSLALWMTYVLHIKHTQKRWIRCRFACELVRGLRMSVPILDPLHLPIGHHDPRWRRFALTVGLLVLEGQDSDDVMVLRDRYCDVRLSEAHDDGQIRHYLRMRPKALWWWNLTGKVSTWSAVMAPFFVMAALINKLSTYLPNAWARYLPEGLSPHLFKEGGWHLEDKAYAWPFVVFLPIALPLIAGVASSLRHILDAGRRKDRYPQMVARLSEIKALLPGLRTPSTIRSAVARSEDMLLDELLEWQLAMSNTGH